MIKISKDSVVASETSTVRTQAFVCEVIYYKKKRKIGGEVKLPSQYSLTFYKESQNLPGVSVTELVTIEEILQNWLSLFIKYNSLILWGNLIFPLTITCVVSMGLGVF